MFTQHYFYTIDYIVENLIPEIEDIKKISAKEARDHMDRVEILAELVSYIYGKNEDEVVEDIQTKFNEFYDIDQDTDSDTVD